jgi:hypothetical protein
MKKLGVAGWALVALALTASSASAEVITLRCTITYTVPPVGPEVHGLVVDTQLRSVRYQNILFTPGGVRSEGTPPVWRRVDRFDNGVIVFGDSETVDSALAEAGYYTYSVDRLTGRMTVLFGTRQWGSGPCERAQAVF